MLLLILAACSDMGTMAAGDLGVSPGGSQDIDYARTLIQEGGIPAREHFTAEGLFSEHDLPVTSAGCEEVLCPVAAASRIDPVDGSGEQLLVQIGFDTALSADTFERRPLSLGVAVDVSGSMADGKLDAVKQALHVMVNQLGERDEMALVAFDDTGWVEMEMTPMDAEGREHLANAVDRLREDGGTNIEAGLSLAYGEVAPGAGASGVEHRVMLFTDAQPNVGDTGMQSFLGMTRYYAEAGIGASVFGVGIDMGTELADAIARTRGGSYHYLATEEEIGQVFDEEFDYLVSPVAYDLDVQVTPTEGLSLLAGWGAPTDGNTSRIDIGASTLFLSARDGGMGATFGGDIEAGRPVASFAMSYEDLDGAVIEDTIEVAWSGGAVIEGREVAADDLGVYKMGVLIDEFLALTAGADFCAGRLDKVEALERIELAASRVDEVADHLGDVPLGEEASLLVQLRANVEGGPRNCRDADTWQY